MSKFTDKIKNYNQLILAVLGTIGVIIVLMGAILLMTELVNSWSPNNNFRNDGIIADEEVNQLSRDSIRKQVISFSRIEVIDSTNQTFVIPVTQANLDNEEKFDDMIDYKSGSSKLSMSYYSRAYNNLVVYNAVSKSSEIIFKERLSVSDYFTHSIENNKYIVITASTFDTNKDKLINSDDFQQLFIYDLSKKEVFKMDAGKNYTALNALVPNKSNQLIAHYGVDRNNDNRFEKTSEPKIYYAIDLNTMTIQELINSDQMQSLQKLLEGS